MAARPDDPSPSAMNASYALRVLARRWWLVLGCVVVAVAASVAHSSRQQDRYEASSSVYVHPSSQLRTAAEQLNELNVLSYGAIVQTIANVAASPATMRHLLASVHPSARAGDYSAVASLQQGTTDIYLAVDGPDRAIALALADRLPAELGARARSDFAVVAVSRLDTRASVRRTQPSGTRDAAIATLVGLLIGLTMAVVTAPARGEPAP